ncbi:MAG: DUF2149 domain-containing protein [Lachnospiraceae bacterium]|nr:DUF2149 domain-containing protein [Lachnospiraceae bacterium]
MKSRLANNFSFEGDDGGTPMDGVSNMSDAMLVLAVGIMLALVINWKIDIKEVYVGQDKKEVVDTSNMQEFNTDDVIPNNQVSLEDIESKYVKSGTVYTDTYTGKTYIVVD